MIHLRILGYRLWLASIDTALGRVSLLLDDTAYLGNLYFWLRCALLQRLANDMLEIAAARVR